MDSELYKIARDYWENESTIGVARRKGDKNSWEDYCHMTTSGSFQKQVLAQRSEKIVGKLKEFFQENDSFSIHEMGCGPGRNLFFIKGAFPNSTISGNDIYIDAINGGKEIYKFNDNQIFVEDSATFAERMVAEKKKFDVIITMAHLCHLPNDIFGPISKMIPKICKLLVSFEAGHSNRETIKAKRLFMRDFQNEKYLGKASEMIMNPINGCNVLFVWKFERNEITD